MNTEPTNELPREATVVVTGATGTQGAAVVRALRSRRPDVRVLALTRDPGSESARALAGLGATPTAADPGDPASVQAALGGADAAFLMTTLSDEAGEAEQGIALVDAALAAGVGHVVQSSVGGAERGTGIPHFESKWRIEQHLRAVAPRAAVVRPVFFMENLRVQDGVLALAMPGDVPLQLVAAADIGRVAATALLEPASLAGGAVEIAGDERTGEEIAATLGARYTALPLDALPDDDLRAMFAWFDSGSAYAADFARTRELAGRDGGGAPLDLAAWAA